MVIQTMDKIANATGIYKNSTLINFKKPFFFFIILYKTTIFGKYKKI